MAIQRILSAEGERASLCNGASCPAFLLTDDQQVIIQGTRLEGDEAASLAAPAHESFVKMPLITLQQILEHL